MEEKAIPKARSWFDRATKINPDIGDIWAYYLKMELQFGDEAKAEIIRQKCISIKPRHGDIWTSISKQIRKVKLKTSEILDQVLELIKL